jgi:peptide-methionine (S)-S-oxide reductase
MTATRRKISSDRVVPYALAGLLALPIVALVAQTGMVGAAEEPVQIPPPAVDAPAKDGMATAVFAGGCFWGVQGVFQHVDGVESAVSGYAGGTVTDPSYKQVSRGNTGHAESVEVTYNPAKVSYGKLLQVFFSVAHDPTQLNRQGPDTGTQYRSAIFVTDPTQEEVAKAYVAQLDAAKVYDAPIVTEIAPLATFYPAEDYHQDYATLHPDQPYIMWNYLPKISNLHDMFPEVWRDQPKLVFPENGAT